MEKSRTNPELAGIFGRLADLIELDGGDHFKVKAYRKGQEVVAALERDLREYLREDSLKSIPGLGPALSRKAVEFLETGRVRKLEDLSAAVPDSVLSLLRLPGMTPRTLQRIRKELGVTCLEDLRLAADDGRLAALRGLSPERKAEIARALDEGC